MATFSCVRRTLIATVILQLIAIFERQVLDFMGYMWLSIAMNFVHVICLILVIFGALQHRAPYVVLGIVWNVLWIGWNAFIVCLHLDVGLLRKDMQILNLGTGTRSWWSINGPGCTATYDFSSIDPVTFRAKIVKVDNCVLAYEHIEVIHSALQLVLSLSMLLGALPSIALLVLQVIHFVVAAVLVHIYRGRLSSTEDMIKPQPIPGYTLSLQHSLPVDSYAIPAPRPALSTIRHGTYDRVSKKTREPVVAETGTTRSGVSGAGSTRRKSTRTEASAEASAAYRPQQGVDNIRVSTMIPKSIILDSIARDQDGTAIYGAYGPTSTKRDAGSPPRRPYTCYNPGSVSPFPTRTAIEASF